MTSSSELKSFISKLICASILKTLNISKTLHTRVLFLSFSITSLSISICCLLYTEAIFSSLNPNITNCETSQCLANSLIQSLMLSTSLYYITMILITKICVKYNRKCYNHCWILKLILYISYSLIGLIFGLFFVSFIKDFFFWPNFILALGFIPVFCVYSVEMAYDLNDTWYENYTQTYSRFWALMLIFSSVLCWTTGCYFLYLSYFSSYFYYILLFFVSCFVLTGLSSSSICENGCI